MKKFLTVILSSLMVLSFGGCSTEGTVATTSPVTMQETVAPSELASEVTSESTAVEPTSITITTLNSSKEAVELEVPYNPQRIAVLDLAVLDILDNFGMGERVVGVSKGSSIDYLQDYVTNVDIVNLGTIKEADLEAVMACEPDVIFIGGRLSAQYDALSEIAPVIFLATDVEVGVVESVRKNATTIASMFGEEDMVANLMSDFDARIKTLADFAKDKNAVVGMVNAGGFNVLGNDGRCSIIGVEVGFENLSNSEVTSTHGNESSFELLVSLNPEYIFVMDRDAAISTEGAQLAKEVIENELVMKTDAYKNGNIVYLAHSNIWYTAEGGITALDVMLQDLEVMLVN